MHPRWAPNRNIPTAASSQSLRQSQKVSMLGLKMSSNDVDTAFPCSLHVDVPFPTARLSTIAKKALSVDKELSPLVQREFSTVAAGNGSPDQCVLSVHYKATTNRMLRVAVNGFMDSLSLVIEVMEKLDADVLEAQTRE